MAGDYLGDASAYWQGLSPSDQQLWLNSIDAMKRDQTLQQYRPSRAMSPPVPMQMKSLPLHEYERMQRIILLFQVHHPNEYADIVNALDMRDRMLADIAKD